MLSRVAILAAISGLAAAQLKVLSPGGPDLWWVASSDNTIVWNCKESQVQNFTIVIANSDPKVLVSPQAIIAIEQNFDCSKTITQQQESFAVGTGYTIQFANPLNNTDVYAQSDPFEIKSAGSAFPATSATPVDSATATSGSATGTDGSSPAATSSSAAISLSPLNVGFVGAILAGVAALF